MWLVFRWNYAVKDIYGPFLTEEEANTHRDHLLEDIEGRIPGDYSVHQINHVQPLISREELGKLLIELMNREVDGDPRGCFNRAFEILGSRLGIPS